MVPLKAKNLCPNTNRSLKNEKFMPKGTTQSRNLCPNINRPLKMRNLLQMNHSTEQFTSKHKQTTQKWEIYTKGTTWSSNLCPNTNGPLKNEKLMPKGTTQSSKFLSKYNQATQKWEIYTKDTNSHTWITQTHNHTRFAKTNTQDSCKHARIQNITTHDTWLT